ncbi:hypothetical protein [Brevundimonas naejangsanensis]|uniref:hypothetical protein n=1 Tax=Brevundimonas naejangsanensis TaxID=588932 RepID=UPI0010692C33|nr:hypothetical protein [Brevundimonas naejangsanensis]QBQ49507.1 hypothetical protein E3U41_12890 [Brevundimonas naejangsanensis]
MALVSATASDHHPCMTEPTLPSIYKTKFVAFVDLLGFREEIKRSADAPILQKRVAEVVDIFQQTACKNEHYDIYLTAFSDSIVLSAEVTKYGLNSLLQMLGQVALNLIQKNILIRGGISLGPIYHAGTITFGPAMIEAYDIENKWAIYPAIILSPEVATKAAEFGSPLVQPDPQRPHLLMVDYLESFRSLSLSGPTSTISSHIQQRLMVHRADGSLYSKAKWLETYWNSAIGSGVLPVAPDPED